MHAANATLKDYFQSELSALRSEAIGFAEQHPQLAGSLGLNARAATDPQVELLLQSFAFLTGRLQHQIEQDKAELPNALLAFLYPHLEAPVPSMLVAQITVKPDGPKEQILGRGRYVTAPAVNNFGRKIDCRFRTCYETPLLPLKVDEIEAHAPSSYPFLARQTNAQSVLRVRLRTDGVDQLQTKGKGPQRLRFYIDNTGPNAYKLYEALALNLSGIAVSVPGQDANFPEATLLPATALRWLGEKDDEAMLQANPHTHPGYRLLQEYFSFPEKFLFFDVDQIGQHDFTGAQNFFDLLFVLDSPLEKQLAFEPTALRLNCVPLINLFSQRIDPVALDHTEYEYHLLGDLENHRYCEIYAIEALESITPNGSPRPIAPYFAMDDFQRLEEQDYFYVARRELSQGSNISGSELFVSFLDQKFDLTQLRDEVVGGRALCTNRRLPEQLMSGSPMHLEGAGPVAKIAVLSKPTPHFTPAQIGERPWMLVSQLALNHLSLAGNSDALAALKDILRLHLGSNAIAGHKQIDAISNTHCRPIMRHVRNADGWRGFVRGTALSLEMDRLQFVEASPVLFCSVLRHFFCLYATVNNLVEVSLETQDLKGTPKQWPPQAGAKPVL